MHLKRYWLDANVFISAKDSIYDFDINKTLWAWLEKQLKAGLVVSSSRVYRELVENQKEDELKRWITARQGIGLCIPPNEDVCAAARRVADFVYSNPRYKQAQAWKFAKGADGWIIAHAIADQGVVVTFETDQKPESQKIRIPDVGAHFGINCINLRGLLKALNAKL